MDVSYPKLFVVSYIAGLRQHFFFRTSNLFFRSVIVVSRSLVDGAEGAISFSASPRRDLETRGVTS